MESEYIMLEAAISHIVYTRLYVVNTNGRENSVMSRVVVENVSVKLLEDFSIQCDDVIEVRI